VTGAGAGVATASAATVDQQAAVSQNWAGYVAGGTQFSSVSGSWVQPTAKCGSGQTYSAFWVGIGGSSNQSSALEQTGTQANCTADGGTEYYAWYELVPAAPVKLDLAIKPGDHISAKVNVSGSNVTVLMSDQTTGQSTSKTLQMDNPDTSSAEWIAEAPSACDGSGATGNCQPLPLADFGTVQFTSATATANGHTGTISDPNWSSQPVQLGGGGVSEVSYGSGTGSSGASPSALSSDGSSFSVAADASSGSTGAAGGAGDYGYGDGGYGDGGYPGAGDGYGYGGYPGDGSGQYWYGDGGYGYGYGDGYGLF
jgi:peptidase A4-like protein